MLGPVCLFLAHLLHVEQWPRLRWLNTRSALCPGHPGGAGLGHCQPHHRRYVSSSTVTCGCVGMALPGGRQAPSKR